MSDRRLEEVQLRRLTQLLRRQRLFLRLFLLIFSTIAVSACGPSRSDSAGNAAANARVRDAFAGLPPDSSRLTAVRLDIGLDAFEPSVSPDGQLVVFRGWSDVFIHDVRTRETRLLCRNSNPHCFAWDPSGTRIAFEGDDSTQTFAKFWIWIVNADGSNLHVLKGTGPDDRKPVWHRDGKSLVWSRYNRLWQSDTTGAEGRFISPPPDRNAYQNALGWTSDGAGVVYLAGTTHGADFVLRVTGADETEDAALLAPFPPVFRWQMGMSADGRLLYRGVHGGMEFAEPGIVGRVSHVLLKDEHQPWDLSIDRNLTLAVFSEGDEEYQDLWLVRLQPEQP
ncbi:MAG: PD40 domain-containing protein [Candidatus Eisenbacteria bacterium]|nr:PD40 domain-containing protein [Candidatus Eisenbacteria bacterium]